MKYNSFKKYNISKKLIEKEKNFNKKYFQLYEGHKSISKGHYVLRHAFNISEYVKNENNEINPKEYLEENRKEKYKFNIYNFEKALKTDKSNKIFSLDDELLKILLYKINRKNIEEKLKKRQEKKDFQSLSLKGLRKKISSKKTFNTNKSIKSYNNLSLYNNSGYKTINSSSINNTSSKNFLSHTNFNETKRTFLRYEPPTKYYFNCLNNRLKVIFQNINSEEKNILTKSDFIKTNFKKTFKPKKLNIKYNYNTINNEKEENQKCIIKNPGKIKEKKDLENLLFKDYDITFKDVKNKLRTIYKNPKLKIQTD